MPDRRTGRRTLGIGGMVVTGLVAITLPFSRDKGPGPVIIGSEGSTRLPGTPELVGPLPIPVPEAPTLTATPDRKSHVVYVATLEHFSSNGIVPQPVRTPVGNR